MELVTAYEDAYTRSWRIVKSAVTETSIVKGSLKTTTRYLPFGRYDKYDENEGADREKVKTEKSKLKTGNTNGAIPGERFELLSLATSCNPAPLSERGALNTHIPLSPWICNPRVLRQGFINPL